MTDAIDVEMSQYPDSHHYNYVNGELQTTYTSHYLTRRSIHKRPKSVSNKPDSTGWRKPSAWSWQHVSFNLNPGNVYEEYLLQPGYVIADSYDGGYDTGALTSSSYEAVAPTPPSNMENRAIIRALSKLKNQGVNFGVALAEASETAGLVSSTVTRIAKAVKVYRSARPKDWLKITAKGLKPQGNDVPSSWLELQYGWLPAMSDVHSACEQLSNRLAGKPPRFTCKAVVSSKFDTTQQCVASPKTRQQMSVKGHHYCKVRLDYELDNLLLATFSSLGLTNPAEILWERTPFSFVVDWFLPIGPWMNVMDAAYGYNFLGGSVTNGTFVEGKALPGLTVAPGYNLRKFYGGHGAVYRSFSGSRRVYTSSPLPWIPGFKNPFTSGHVANALSLLTQVFR